jgi:hypothetical protein
MSGATGLRQLLFGPPRCRGRAAGPLRRLQGQRRAVSVIPGILALAQAAAFGGVEQERPVLPAAPLKRDIPGAVVCFFDTGHFALETHAREIAGRIREFLK